MARLGQQIRARRQSLGMTLDVLSGAVGYTKGYLSAIETGKRPRPPSEELLGRLERALGLEEGKLIRESRWESTPREIREIVRELSRRSRAAARLASLVLGEKGSGAAWSAEIERLATEVRGLGAPLREGVQVPVLGSAGGGYPAEPAGESRLWDQAVGVVSVPVELGDGAYAVRVVGDSMKPDYEEGDVVILSPGPGWRSGADGLVYLRGGGSRFCRVFCESGGGGQEMVRLQPVNHACPSEVVAAGAVGWVHEAVYVLRRAGRRGSSRS